MFRFEHSEYFYLLVILPLLVSLFLHYTYSKKKSLQHFGTMKLLISLMPDVAIKKHYIKFCIVFICTGLFILVIVGPQFNSKLETVKKQGTEIIICIDVSNSMLSTDITPTRLDKAKQIFSCLVDKLKNDRIGLIIFAGNAFIQLPITSDYISAKMFLSSINPSMVPEQGTAIGKAINLAMKSFTPNENFGKTIILITDGEDHEDNAIAAAKAAAKKGFTVHTLGIGSIKGCPIPIHNSYLKDKNGNIVLTKLNEAICKEISIAGNGIYVRVNNTNNALKALQKELNKKAKSEIENKVYSSYEEKYYIPACILLFLLIAEFFILEKVGFK